MTKRAKILIAVPAAILVLYAAGFFVIPLLVGDPDSAFAWKCGLAIGEVKEQRTGWKSWHYCESRLPAPGSGKTCGSDSECPSGFCKRTVISDLEIAGRPQLGHCSGGYVMFRKY